LATIATDPALFATQVHRAVDRLRASVRNWLCAETNVNFAEPTAAGLIDAWPPATRARLAELRRRYDPDGVFASGDAQLDALLRSP
jgi:hypothetical protein